MTRIGQPGSRRAIIARARQFRADPTPAEAKAWEILHNRRCLGLKFRRQWPLLGFIVDFYCPELKLVIEIDGAVHADKERVAQDRYRDAMLRELRVRIVRISNCGVTAGRLIAAIKAGKE
jgi:very-short-patch-repair endonuclease